MTTEKCSKRRTLIFQEACQKKKKQRAIKTQELTAARLIAWSAKGPYRKKKKGITAWQRTQNKDTALRILSSVSCLRLKTALVSMLPYHSEHSLENRDDATSAPFKRALLLVDCVFSALCGIRVVNTNSSLRLVISHLIANNRLPSRSLPFWEKHVGEYPILFRSTNLLSVPCRQSVGTFETKKKSSSFASKQA